MKLELDQFDRALLNMVQENNLLTSEKKNAKAFQAYATMETVKRSTKFHVVPDE